VMHGMVPAHTAVWGHCCLGQMRCCQPELFNKCPNLTLPIACLQHCVHWRGGRGRGRRHPRVVPGAPLEWGDGMAELPVCRGPLSRLLAQIACPLARLSGTKPENNSKPPAFRPCLPACHPCLPACLQVMSREMFNPQFSLFQPTPEGGTTFQVRPCCACCVWPGHGCLPCKTQCSPTIRACAPPHSPTHPPITACTYPQRHRPSRPLLLVHPIPRSACSPTPIL
jgi:hypothetical protein